MIYRFILNLYNIIKILTDLNYRFILRICVLLKTISTVKIDKIPHSGHLFTFKISFELFFY